MIRLIFLGLERREWITASKKRRRSPTRKLLAYINQEVRFAWTRIKKGRGVYMDGFREYSGGKADCLDIAEQERENQE